jgi:hypothetical protein
MRTQKIRLLAILLCIMLAATLLPAVLPVSATGEGEWTVYQSADSYPAYDDEPNSVYPPVAGYEYTNDGFTVIQPDWTDLMPFVTVTTKDPVNLKEGFFVKFRVDEYSYDGGKNADQWICLTVGTGFTEADGTRNGKVQPGSVKHGGGWMTLLRGKGDGAVITTPHLTDPQTEGFGGTFINHGGTSKLQAPMDEEGREVYTLDIRPTDAGYEIRVNGVLQEGGSQADELLNRLSPNGEFFVGITLFTAVKNGRAGLTVLEYGTSEETAITPAGKDSRVPDENVCVYVPIIDSDTIPANSPAILWDPETYPTKSGHNLSFVQQGDNTWKLSAVSREAFFSFSPKRSWSYEAEDFPVVGILFRNLWGVEDASVWYSAGMIGGGVEEPIPISLADGRYYGENDEYLLVPVDLTGLWNGRIMNIRVDLEFTDPHCDFELCFVGMFRSTDEAYAYTENRIGPESGVSDPVPTEPPTEPPFDPEVTVPTDLWESVPEELITEIVSAVESILDTEEGETGDRMQAVEDVLSKYGCTGSLCGTTLLMAAAAACLLRKRKE